MDDAEVCDSSSAQPNPSASSEAEHSFLPPCRVCGEKSSGFHYGANTCEACKAFFRRSIKRTKDYKCPETGTCQIRPGQRSLCPHCRLKICLSVGMSKSAIKTGRYTLEKHTQNILEVKKLRQQRQTSRGPVQDSPSEQQETACASPVLSFDCDEMIRALTESHDRHIVTKLTMMSDEEMAEKQKLFYEEYKLKQEVFGPLTTLSREQYEEIYQTTGLDVDNRQSLLQYFLDQADANNQLYISFAKTIPGFSELPLEDQMSLVRGGRFEFHFMGNFRGQNHDLEVVVSASGKCFHVEEFKKLACAEFGKSVMEFGKTMKKLNLLPDEIVLLKTVCLLFTDRCELKNPTKVEEIQWKLIQCLLYLLEKNHREEKGLFARVMDRLVAVRNLTEKETKLAGNLNYFPDVHISPLLLDMYNMK